MIGHPDTIKHLDKYLTPLIEVYMIKWKNDHMPLLIMLSKYNERFLARTWNNYDNVYSECLQIYKQISI